MNKLLSTAEVAEILGIGVDKVRDFIAEGKLKASKLGGNGKSRRHWRIKQTDLEAFIEGKI